MDPDQSITSVAPYATIALLIAGLAWYAVARAAGKKADGKGGHNVFALLAGAGYFTSAAFILVVIAYLTR